MLAESRNATADGILFDATCRRECPDLNLARLTLIAKNCYASDVQFIRKSCQAFQIWFDIQNILCIRDIGDNLNNPCIDRHRRSDSGHRAPKGGFYS